MDYNLDQLKFFLRKNQMLPLAGFSKNTKHMDISDIDVIAYVEDVAKYTLFDDDGFSYDFDKTGGFRTEFSIENRDGQFEVNIDNNNPNIKNVRFKIYKNDGSKVIITKEV